MPSEDLQTLLDLNNNPAIVDLREADKFLEEIQ
jgi:rhodanese-related sulfurtransferase